MVNLNKYVRSPAVLGLAALVSAASVSPALAQDSRVRDGAGRRDERAAPRSRAHAGHGKLKSLDLSRDQKRQLREVRHALRAKKEDIRRSSRSPEEMRADLRDVRQKKRERLAAILTPEQQRELRAERREARREGSRGRHRNRAERGYRARI